MYNASPGSQKNCSRSEKPTRAISLKNALYSLELTLINFGFDIQHLTFRAKLRSTEY